MSSWMTGEVRTPVVTSHRTRAKKFSMGAVLAELAQHRPELAARLSRINWQQMITAVARRALKRVARAQKLVLENRYIGYDMPRGTTCVGVLVGRERSLGLGQNGSSLFFFWRGESQDMSAEQKRLQQAFEEKYRVEAVAAALEIIGNGRVDQQEQPSGTVVLTTELKEVS